MAAGCPSDEALAAFVERRGVDPAAAKGIEAHLDDCASCRVLAGHLAAVAQLEGGSTMASPEARTLASGVTHVSPPGAAGGDASLAPGSRFDRYVVDHELGRGGMGVVVAAFDSQLHRRVAVKVVRPDDDDLDARERLLREARAMARLSHPNVVTVHDVGEQPDGRVFVAMELVDGASLRAVLAGPRPPARTLDLFVQAARGLAAAHAAGLVHRDFKPDNVLVGKDGRVRVTDFGLVRGGGDIEGASPLTLVDGRALTATGAILGTPAYMAPEQHVGLRATEKADQYAFAASLYEGLTGRRPFAGNDLSTIRDAKLAGRREPWPNDPGIPEAVRVAVDRALARDPNQRHASMSELIAILEGAHRHLVNMPTGVAPPLALAPAPPVLAPPPVFAPALTPAARYPAASGPAFSPPPRALPPRSSALGLWLWVVVPLIVIVLAFAAMIVIARISVEARPSSVATDSTDPSAPADRTETSTPADPPELTTALPSVPAFTLPFTRITPGTKLPCPPGAHQEGDELWLRCVVAGAGTRTTVLEGPSVWLRSNGTISRYQSYRADKPNGAYWELDEEGRPTLYATHVDGQFDGPWIELRASGRPRTETVYRNGVPHGIARRWDEDGKLSSWTRFENGRRVETHSVR